MKYTVRRGANAGATLVPHCHNDGRYVASPTRFASDYEYFDTAAQAFDHALAKGWGIRMSNDGKGPASLIKADRCER